MAHPAVGLAAPAHPELDDPAARARLRRRRPGRLPRRAPRWSELLDDYAADAGAPVRDRHDGHLGPARPAAATWCETDRGTWHAPHRRGGDRRHPRRRCRRWPRRCPPGITSVTARGLPQPRPAARRRRAGRRRLGERRPDRRRAAALRPAGDPGRRRARADAAHLPGPRHPVVDGRVGPARRALRTRCPTWSGRATCRRCSSSARGAHASTSNALRGLGVRLVGRLAGAPRRRRRSSPARWPTCARWPTSSWAGCSTRSTRGPTGRASTRRAAAVRPDRGAARRRCRLDLGSGEIASVVWATGYRPDLSWLDVPVFDRKGRVVHDGGVTPSPGLYADRPAVPAPPPVDADRRRPPDADASRPRRPTSLEPPGRTERAARRAS